MFKQFISEGVRTQGAFVTAKAEFTRRSSNNQQSEKFTFYSAIIQI